MATPPPPPKFLHQPLPFQFIPHFLAKNFVPPQVTQLLEGPISPFNKGGGPLLSFFSLPLNFKILFLWPEVVLRFKALDNEANNNSCVVEIHQ